MTKKCGQILFEWLLKQYNLCHEKTTSSSYLNLKELTRVEVGATFVGPEAVPTRRVETGVALVATQWTGCKLNQAFVTQPT